MYVKQALDKFGKALVKQSRANLTRKKKNSSNSLYKSISYEAIESKNSFQFTLSMEDYGTFIDKGVHGIGGTKADGTSWKKKTVVNSPYSYRNPSKTSSNGRFKQSLGGWTIKKGIAPRNKSGQFTSRKGLIIAIRKSIFHTGLETTNFLTRPFEQAFKKLPNQIIEAYSLDVDSLLKSSLE